MEVSRDRIPEVAEQLAGMQGVSEAYSVAGRYDLAAVLRVKDNESLADLVTRRMLRLEGIRKTETLFAFRAYSRHDLESMFQIGIQ
ncbi:MAG: Lrp/AsnC ligand binding domain-containing protein [Nitrospirota bacterium]|jgi:DNA-binding Lrp family transcriptional regulator